MFSVLTPEIERNVTKTLKSHVSPMSGENFIFKHSKARRSGWNRFSDWEHLVSKLRSNRKQECVTCEMWVLQMSSSVMTDVPEVWVEITRTLSHVLELLGSWHLQTLTTGWPFTEHLNRRWVTSEAIIPSSLCFSSARLIVNGCSEGSAGSDFGMWL